MNSEWMQVMLDEIARKKVDKAAAEAELKRRSESVDAGRTCEDPPVPPRPAGVDP